MGNPISPDDFEGWYVVRTKAHMERRVAEELGGLGLDTYVPLERHTVGLGRRAHVVERPLLLRYIFADIRLKGDFYRIKIASGVDTILSSTDGKPHRVNEHQLDRLRELEGAGLFDMTVKPHSTKGQFTAGQTVKILDGPFAGFLGTIERGGEAKSFQVLTWLFGRATKITLDARELKAA